MEKRTLTVKILIGVPASGKSTFTKDFLRKNQDWAAVSRDDFRYMFRNEGKVDLVFESIINDMMDMTIIKLLNAKKNVIIDATNLQRKYIEAFCKLVQFKANVEFMVFDVPMATCIERDKARERSVGEEVIKKMYKDYKNIIDSDVFTSRTARPSWEDRFVPMIQDKSLPEAVIFDIDGTLATMGRRSPYDWSKVDIDDVNDLLHEQLNFQKSLGRKIIVVTGRDAAAREKTEYWLDFYGIYYDELHTRGKDVPGKDTRIKKDIFLKEISPRYNVVCVYDDRLSVVKMWHDIGIFCFNVNQGLKEF